MGQEAARLRPGIALAIQQHQLHAGWNGRRESERNAVLQFVRTRILEPAGLTSAADFDANPRAANADWLHPLRLGPLRVAPDAGSGWMWAAGELAMTPTDLARWTSSHSARCSRPLRIASSTRSRPQQRAGTGYALGLDVGMQGGRFMIEHSGKVSGFTARTWYFRRTAPRSWC